MGPEEVQAKPGITTFCLGGKQGTVLVLVRLIRWNQQNE